MFKNEEKNWDYTFNTYAHVSKYHKLNFHLRLCNFVMKPVFNKSAKKKT